jgi:hypothetical protein
MGFRFSFPVLRFSFLRFNRHHHLQSSDPLCCLVVSDEQVEDSFVLSGCPVGDDDAPRSAVF